MTKGYKWWFWGIIVAGALMPLAVITVVEIIFNPKDFLNTLLSSFPSFILMGLPNSIPFIALAFLVKTLWNRPEGESFQNYLKHKIGVIAAGIFSVGFIFYINIELWVSINLHLPGSSTGVIIYALIPPYGFIALLVGYGFGWIIGRIILWYKETKV